MKKTALYVLLIVTMLQPALFSAAPAAGEEMQSGSSDYFAPPEIHGFCELRAGCRTGEDPDEKDISVMEARVQAELFTYSDAVEIKYRGDLWADAVTEKGEYDTREAWFFSRPLNFMDIKAGRQVLTWGTGDLVFLNDLFPKDWQSFFIGRDMEYLKAPSDAAKFSFFSDFANMDLVYTPKFDPDRYITGEYISFQDGTGGTAGRHSPLHAETPDEWFRDDEISVRLYENVRNYELALYGYRGFWKSPGGRTSSGTFIFPALDVLGASVRGQVGPGIGNLEVAWYRSTDDTNGTDPLINNSEMRYLAGYAQDLGDDLNASLQYYVEQVMDYDEYRAGLDGSPARDRFRHVITLQLTKLMMNQNLELSLSGYGCPSDRDAYLRPCIHYKYTDMLFFETGANIFFGDQDHTFFARFRDNTNVYVAVRYSL